MSSRSVDVVGFISVDVCIRVGRSVGVYYKKAVCCTFVFPKMPNQSIIFHWSMPVSRFGRIPQIG
jgi:hypothetical protein